MSRIKLVLNERRIALMQAQKAAREPVQATGASQAEELDEDLYEDKSPVAATA